MLENAVNTQRPTCYTCLRPTDFCNCRFIHEKIVNKTQLLILQHPHERTHPFGTVRLVRLGLENVEVEVCFKDLQSNKLTGLASERAALLYPSPKALVLESLPPGEHPETLIVLDGTWSQAKALYKSNPALAQLRHVRLEPRQLGQYRIRKEPKPHCVSTLEAIVQALQILEPGHAPMKLLEAFTAMVDQQIEHRAKLQGVPRSKRRSSKC
jgi:DTW domain-containing protein